MSDPTPCTDTDTIILQNPNVVHGVHGIVIAKGREIMRTDTLARSHCAVGTELRSRRWASAGEGSAAHAHIHHWMENTGYTK